MSRRVTCFAFNFAMDLAFLSDFRIMVTAAGKSESELAQQVTAKPSTTGNRKTAKPSKQHQSRHNAGCVPHLRRFPVKIRPRQVPICWNDASIQRQRLCAHPCPRPSADNGSSTLPDAAVTSDRSRTEPQTPSCPLTTSFPLAFPANHQVAISTCGIPRPSPRQKTSYERSF